MTKTQLIALYKAAEKRANPCAAGFAGAGGLAFKIEDRIALAEAMTKIQMTPYATAIMICGNYAASEFPATHGRLATFRRQVDAAALREGPAANGLRIRGVVKPVVKATVQEEVLPFDGRIKSKRDVQPAFNRAAVQLIRVGITSPSDALRFLTAGFEFAKVEQKLDQKTERLVQELQMGDLSREQVLAVLDKVKAKF